MVLILKGLLFGALQYILLSFANTGVQTQQMGHIFVCSCHRCLKLSWVLFCIPVTYVQSHQMGVVLYTCHRCSESSDGYYFVFLRQVFKVIKNYQPTLGDELELIEGDYVFMAPGQSSPDGWYSGTSWLTGNTGMFPAVFTQRTSETWIWTLHRWVDVSVAPVSDKTHSFL